jgi:hypothetical protein
MAENGLSWNRAWRQAESELGPAPKQGGRSAGTFRFLIVLLVTVALVVAVFSLQAWMSNRVVGEVTAEELADAYLTRPCSARSDYDGDLWTVTGTVIGPVTAPTNVVSLSGAAPAHVSRSSCGRTEPIFSGVTRRAIVSLQWPTSVTKPDVGDVVRMTCRIKIPGFGFYHFLRPGPEVAVIGEACTP